MRGRKRLARCIRFDPEHTCFKPCGVRGRGLQTVELRADEFEALRLMDYEGLYQEECAARMEISRTTLSRTVASARRKVVDVLLHGKRLLVVPNSEAESVSLDSLLPGTSSSGAAGQRVRRT
jgi:predicted DNA-binding protein (UPF0251 family)